MDAIKDFFAQLAEFARHTQRELEPFLQLVIDNIWAVLPFAVTTLIAVLGVAYARKQDTRAKKQDTAVPALQVDFFGCPDAEVKDFFFLLPLRENRAIFVPLKVNIGNTGPVSADDVELHLQVSEQLYRSEGLGRLAASVAAARNIKHGVDPLTGSSVVQVLITCGSIAPQVRFNLTDTVVAQGETYIPQTISVETKDHVKLELNLYLYCWFELTVSVTARDMPPQVHRFNLHFRTLHPEPQADFLAEETQRRSKISFEGMKDEMRQELLLSPQIQTFMRDHGMAYDVDQPLPEKLALIWFQKESVPDFVSQDDLPDGHDVIAVTDEKTGFLEAKGQRRKRNKTKKKQKR